MKQHTPKKLDRIRLVELVRKPREEIERDISEIWDRRMKADEPIHHRYMNIGTNLISYNGIKGDIRFFNELEQRFRALGQNVAALTLKHNKRGLIDEEPTWLGMLKHQDGPPSPIRHFAPFGYLETLDVMKELDPSELTMLYIAYTEGKQGGFLYVPGREYE